MSLAVPKLSVFLGVGIFNALWIIIVIGRRRLCFYMLIPLRRLKPKLSIELAFLRIRSAVPPCVLQNLPLKTWPVTRNT